MVHGLIPDLIIFLAVAVVVTPLCHRLHVSPILGYLAAGLAAGPSGLALGNGGEGAAALADLGVAFLLFMIGLELSLDRLKVIRDVIFGLGTAQLVATGLVGAVVLWVMGLTPKGALVMGLALAFSSTAFVIQALSERNELAGQTGRVAVAMLILQDLAVVPLLVMIPRLGGDGISLALALVESLAKAALAMAAIFALARVALRPFFRLVAATRSPDAFVAAALLAVVGTSYATQQMGLSHVLGAFLAGAMLASSEYRHQIEADLTPIRGLLMGLFFLTVGMRVDLSVLWNHAALVAGGTVALLTGKAALIAGFALLFGLPWATAARLGLLLAQGGEFALVVAARAGATGLIDSHAVDLLTAIVAVSMATTPLFAELSGWIGRRQRRAEAEPHRPGKDAGDLDSHVIICGYGRVGRTVGRVLADRGIPFVAIDRDPGHVAALRAKGEPVYFGDIRTVELLRAVGAARARAVILTISAGTSRLYLVQRLRRHFPDLQVLARAHDLAQAHGMEKAGASVVVPETLEGSLRLAGLALKRLGVPGPDVDAAIEDYRRDDYARLAEGDGGDDGR